jgi:hypothetical protein
LPRTVLVTARCISICIPARPTVRERY